VLACDGDGDHDGDGLAGAEDAGAELTPTARIDPVASLEIRRQLPCVPPQSAKVKPIAKKIIIK
jgi:hypothetical protein